MPRLAERNTEHLFFNPENGVDRKLIDANRFTSEGVAETINLFAKTFKEALGRSTLVSTYYADIIHGHGTSHNSLKVPSRPAGTSTG